MIRFTAMFFAYVLAMIPSAVSAGTEPQAANPEEIIRLAGRVLQDHPYLLDSPQREQLDKAHRAGREATEQRRRERGEEAKARRSAEQKKAASQIVTVLEASPKLTRLKLQPGREVMPPLDPFDLPADTGALLIRAEIDDGGGQPAVRAVIKSVDFSGVDAEQSIIPVDVAPSGVSLVLIEMVNVPKKRISQRLDLKTGDHNFRMPIELRTPPPGRIKLTVLSETGKPTPAMVRLVSADTGRTRRIDNLVDIKNQFDSQGRQTSERPLIVPGPKGGDYYCMPEPLDMELPAGRWNITVRRGIEHVAVNDSFTVEPGRTVEKTYQPRRWEDMRKRGWWSGDDHVHCRVTSNRDAEKLMAYAQAEDVHLCNVVKMGDIFRTWFEQRGFGPQYRVTDGDYILSPGQECPRTHQQIGHTISMNTRRMVRDTDQYYLYDKVFDQVHADGGLCGYAHVCSKMFYVHRDMSINVPKGKVDFAEVLQFANLGLDLWYRFLNAGFKLTASAGSDIPWGGTLGEVRVYAYLGDQPFSADAWFEAMRQGHTFVSNGPMLEMTVDDALPGDELTVSTDRKVRVKARAWGDPEHTVPTKLVIVRHGEEIKVVESSDPKRKELTVDMELDAGSGFWIAAHAVGTNGEHAHTTPTYVVRPGLRFWKYEDVDKLVAEAMGALDEIENIVADARQKNEQGKIDDDRTLKQLALQGPELLKRVAEARDIWQNLKTVAAQEAPLRKKGQ